MFAVRLLACSVVRLFGCSAHKVSELFIAHIFTVDAYREPHTLNTHRTYRTHHTRRTEQHSIFSTLNTETPNIPNKQHTAHSIDNSMDMEMAKCKRLDTAIVCLALLCLALPSFSAEPLYCVRAICTVCTVVWIDRLRGFPFAFRITYAVGCLLALVLLSTVSVSVLLSLYAAGAGAFRKRA